MLPNKTKQPSEKFQNLLPEINMHKSSSNRRMKELQDAIKDALKKYEKKKEFTTPRTASVQKSKKKPPSQ